MNPAEALDRLHELNVRSLQETDPKAAEIYQDAARWLIAVRRGEIKCKFRRMTLEDGKPVAPTDSAA